MKMASEPLDLLIIGGGINGAGIARDAAMRGLRTGLIEKNDFGSGTSGNSSRLIHGGLRYLELGDLRLVFEASRERRTLLKIAPHLVWPRSFLFPVHAGDRVPKWKLRAGLLLYDILSVFRNVAPHRMLSKEGTIRAEPYLKKTGLKGAGKYYDCQCDDMRLTLANVRASHRYGALVANYVKADGFEPADGTVHRVKILDRINEESHTVQAKVIVNATGPWSDRLRKELGEAPVLRPTKGVHVAVPRRRIGNETAITMTSPIDGRVMFIVPWGELAYIGTTDTDDQTDPEMVRAEAEDVIYLLRSANAMFPDARLKRDDVVSTWAGVRPMVSSEGATHPGQVSREHRILDDGKGVLSVVGGKLTTYRSVAAETVDLVGKRLHELDGRSIPARAKTAKEALPGGEAQDYEVLVREIARQGVSVETAQHLTRTYGTEAAGVVNLTQGQPELREPIAAGHPSIKAEIVHTIRREMVMTLSDLMIRRIHLYYEVLGHGLPELPDVADLAAEELGWDPGRKALEMSQYLKVIHDAMAFRDDIGET